MIDSEPTAFHLRPQSKAAEHRRTPKRKRIGVPNDGHGAPVYSIGLSILPLLPQRATTDCARGSGGLGGIRPAEAPTPPDVRFSASGGWRPARVSERGLMAFSIRSSDVAVDSWTTCVRGVAPRLWLEAILSPRPAGFALRLAGCPLRAADVRTGFPSSQCSI